MNSQPPFLFLIYFQLNELWPCYNRCPDNFEPRSSLKLSFTNIWVLCSNFVECESLLELHSPDILPLCGTHLDDSIDSGNFFMSGYLHLIQKYSITHMHGYAIYAKEGLPFARDLSLEKFKDAYSCLRLALLHSVSFSFFPYESPSLLLCRVFQPISSNIDEVLSINPCANVFVFKDFNVNHKDCLIYSGGADKLGELCYIFSIWNNFPTVILDYDSHSPVFFLDLFISSDGSIFSTMTFPPLGNSINFPINSK